MSGLEFSPDPDPDPPSLTLQREPLKTEQGHANRKDFLLAGKGMSQRWEAAVTPWSLERNESPCMWVGVRGQEF